MSSLEKVLEDTAVELLRRASTELRQEYVEALRRALETCEGSIGRSQLEAILRNIELARRRSEPICQDTGIIGFIARIGEDFPIRAGLRDILVRATRRATEEIPLRPNAVDLLRGNTGDNVGVEVPILHIELVGGDELELTALPKGGGSSNVAAHSMITPGLGIRGVKRFVVEAVARAGSLGCPPYFVGVGIGGTEDYCMLLAKKALLKPFRVRSPDPNIAALEEELLERVNELGIGIMGLGEGPTALDLHVEVAARHPATMPVGVVMSCWALRHASARVTREGRASFI
jgi:fumarate hydratase subunit alpha